jgi:hypothetical protein
VDLDSLGDSRTPGSTVVVGVLYAEWLAPDAGFVDVVASYASRATSEPTPVRPTTASACGRCFFRVVSFGL